MGLATEQLSQQLLEYEKKVSIDGGGRSSTSQVSDKAASSVPFKQNIFLKKKYVKINVNKQFLYKNGYIWNSFRAFLSFH